MLEIGDIIKVKGYEKYGLGIIVDKNKYAFNAVKNINLFDDCECILFQFPDIEWVNYPFCFIIKIIFHNYKVVGKISNIDDINYKCNCSCCLIGYKVLDKVIFYCPKCLR